MNTSNNSILDRLAADARRRRVALNLPNGTLTWEQMLVIRNQFQAMMDSHPKKISLTKAAKRLGDGYSYATLYSFMTASDEVTMKCNGQKVARALNSLCEQLALEMEAPKLDGFVETRVAQRILTLVRLTIQNKGISLVYSDAGRGKTKTAEAALELFPGSIYVRCRTRTMRQSALVASISQACGLSFSTSSMHVQLNRVIKTLADSNRLLQIDEAHRLADCAIEVVRDLCDECKIPIVMYGTRDINIKCTDTAQWFGQLNRRITARLDVTEEARGDRHGRRKPLHTVDEIIRIWEADKIRLTSDGAERLFDIANALGQGGLGICDRIVRVAVRAAGDKPLDAQLIDSVYTRLHGKEHTNSQLEEAIKLAATA